MQSFKTKEAVRFIFSQEVRITSIIRRKEIKAHLEPQCPNEPLELQLWQVSIDVSKSSSSSVYLTEVNQTLHYISPPRTQVLKWMKNDRHWRRLTPRACLSEKPSRLRQHAIGMHHAASYGALKLLNRLISTSVSYYQPSNVNVTTNHPERYQDDVCLLLRVLLTGEENKKI